MLQIAIIGAGPAGLTFANLLSKSTLASRISCTIFEAISSESKESQGGTLDLHEKTGLAALRKADLLDEFNKYARYDGNEMFMADKNNIVMIHMPAGQDEQSQDEARPEIDRVDLVKILRARVPSIQWDSKLKACTTDGMLQFVKGNSQGPFDLVVGADGAWSKVRDCLTTTKPQYSGISGYELTIPTPTLTCPNLDKMVGKGSYISSSDGKLLNSQRMRDGSLKIRSWYKCPEHSAQESLDENSPEATVNDIIGRYEGWAPELLEMVRQADSQTIRVWPCYELPVGHTWEHKPGFTLLGDAASLSAPFSGEGVNKAMKDALDLTTFLEEALKDGSRSELNVAVRHYEETMFVRALKLQKMTEQHKEAFFSGRSLASAIPIMIKNMISDHESAWVRILGGSAPVMGLAHAYLWWKGKAAVAGKRRFS